MLVAVAKDNFPESRKRMNVSWRTSVHTWTLNNVGALASQSPTDQPKIAHLLERALRESTDDTVGNIADARLEREE